MFVCVYARAYVCLHVGMYVYTYACMYVCMYVSVVQDEGEHSQGNFLLTRDANTRGRQWSLWLPRQCR